METEFSTELQSLESSCSLKCVFAHFTLCCCALHLCVRCVCACKRERERERAVGSWPGLPNKSSGLLHFPGCAEAPKHTQRFQDVTFYIFVLSNMQQLTLSLHIHVTRATGGRLSRVSIVIILEPSTHTSNSFGEPHDTHASLPLATVQRVTLQRD